MIRRESENGWILFMQHDHARLSGDIMKFWGNGHFSSIKPFEEVMYAINNHDSGWIDWDSCPKINKQNKYPANFMEMNNEEQEGIWIKSFENCFDAHSYSSALIALHFSKLNENSMDGDRNVNGLLDFQEKARWVIRSVLGAKYSSFKNNDLSDEVMVNLKFLQIGDIISLTLCNGWSSSLLKDVPLDHKSRTTVDVTLQSSDGFKYKVNPNPFSIKKLNISISGKRLLKKMFESDDDLRYALSRSQWEEFYFTIE